MDLLRWSPDGAYLFTGCKGGSSFTIYSCSDWSSSTYTTEGGMLSSLFSTDSSTGGSGSGGDGSTPSSGRCDNGQVTEKGDREPLTENHGSSSSTHPKSDRHTDTGPRAASRTGSSLRDACWNRDGDVLLVACSSFVYVLDLNAQLNTLQTKVVLDVGVCKDRRDAFGRLLKVRTPSACAAGGTGGLCGCGPVHLYVCASLYVSVCLRACVCGCGEVSGMVCCEL